MNTKYPSDCIEGGAGETGCTICRNREACEAESMKYYLENEV